MKATETLHDQGQSLWLDNITRDLLHSGTLERYIDELSVTGLTSNPTIFDQAIKNSSAYDAAIRKKIKEGKSGEALFFELALEDLTQAADLFRPIWDRTNGVDGWVSLEVSPLLARDTASTLGAAKALHARAGRPNLLIKIFPALQAMVNRGHLAVPIIGVAKAGWTVDELRARVHDSVEQHPGLEAPAFDALSGMLRYVDGDITFAIGADVIAPGQETRSQTAEQLGTRLPRADEMDVYERVLGDAMQGDATVFAREDYVEEAWRIVDPVVNGATSAYGYEPGSWGPAEVDSVSPPGGWQNPMVPVP